MNNRLAEARMERGMTQGQVSAVLKTVEPRADVGMVSRYEKGVCLPTRAQLEAMEGLYSMVRTELYDWDDLDLVGPAPLGSGGGPDIRAQAPGGAEKAEKMLPPSHAGRYRKCYRISKEFAASLPDDLLQVCGFSSWQSWHDAALRRLLEEYEARKKESERRG